MGVRERIELAEKPRQNAHRAQIIIDLDLRTFCRPSSVCAVWHFSLRDTYTGAISTRPGYMEGSYLGHPSCIAHVQSGGEFVERCVCVSN